METVWLDGVSLNVADVLRVVREGASVALSEQAKVSVKKAEAYVASLVENERVVYGITTGFGKFSDVHISSEQSGQLQKNLIMSHACGVGRHFPPDVVKTVMLLRANALAQGFSGVRLQTLETLIAMLNKGVLPAIPEKGSLGASGDLAPLAHMVLPLIGLGEAYFGGAVLPGQTAMDKAGVKPVVLTSKEGLALINGTQVMTAVGLLAAAGAVSLLKLADIAAALTMEALNGVTDAFIPEIHAIRPHPGQMRTADNVLRLLRGSGRTTKQGEMRVQDAYALRCVPQIHGASKDAAAFVLSKVLIEINAVTDNPIILADKDMAISGGNFHGQPMALPFDFLGIAIAEIANVSERRVERLVNPALSCGLPAFLTEHGGLNSGFMIAQYAAAALVSENKVLAHPASVDSIPSSANQEDHVSMGTVAARKAAEILENAKRVLAIELLAAAQGIDLNHGRAGRSAKLGAGTQAAYDVIRAAVPQLHDDRVMYPDMNRAFDLVDSGAVVRAAEEAAGELAIQ